MLSSGRTVLSMMDDALYIYKKNARAVELVSAVSWDTERFEETVANIITGPCQKAPVVIVNDMVEQHYRKERVLTSGVSILDRSAMTDRKLNMAFPNYPIRAALPLKEKIKNEGGKMSSDVFIFAAIPSSPQVTKTIDAVNRSLVSTKGMVLLPVESSDLVQSLAKKLRQKNDLAAKWVVFIGQHRNGNLRQIVTKDGEVALTRMSPIVNNDENPQEWATEVVQEFRATMSYLTRFGFQAEDGLDIILISDLNASKLVGEAMDERFNFQALTATKAASLIGGKPGEQDNERYADPLHIGWIAKKTSFILPMRSKMLESVSRPRQVAGLVALGLVGTALFLLYLSVSSISHIGSTGAEVDQRRQEFNVVNSDYQKEVKKKEALGFDIRLIQSSIGVFKDFKKTNIKPLYFLKSVGEALGPNLRVDKIDIQAAKKEGVQAAARARFGEKPELFVATLQITYPSSSNIVKGNQEVRDLRDKIAIKLPGDVVEVSKLLKDYNYVEEITVETGDVDSSGVEQDFIAEITVKGTMTDG